MDHPHSHPLTASEEYSCEGTAALARYVQLIHATEPKGTGKLAVAGLAGAIPTLQSRLAVERRLLDAEVDAIDFVDDDSDLDDFAALSLARESIADQRADSDDQVPSAPSAQPLHAPAPPLALAASPAASAEDAIHYSPVQQQLQLQLLQGVRAS